MGSIDQKRHGDSLFLAQRNVVPDDLVSLLEPPPLAGSSSSLIASELLLQPGIVVVPVPNPNAEQSLVGCFFTCSCTCSVSLSHDVSIDVFSLISLHKRLVI